MSNKNDEIILVVPRAALFGNEKLTFQGSSEDAVLVETLNRTIDNNVKRMRRGDAEEDTSYKQPIPYVVIKRENELFVYERLQGGGETRLHNKLSLGVGGHMNPIPGISDFEGLLRENLKRELQEELEISAEVNVNIIGYINDDSNEVGQVHIGLLGMIELNQHDTVVVKETDQLAGAWMSIEQLTTSDVYEHLENWSKIVVDILKTR